LREEKTNQTHFHAKSQSGKEKRNRRWTRMNADKDKTKDGGGRMLKIEEEVFTPLREIVRGGRAIPRYPPYCDH
jgi:hypothetical protein